ncbi:MAG: class I SAM-dependent methyltransferase [Elusimicrobia bacterium]|nr:class I SAM-dependent methyltransferase [Elusimicrobiota bacterium]
MTPEAAEARDWLESRGTPLAPEACALLDGYARDVLEYGRRTNITAAKDLGTVWRRHILDGLCAAAALKRRIGGGKPRIVDLGCGAGFVGVALKAAWPEAEVWLVDTVYRKAAFLTLETVRLGLAGLKAFHARADGTGSLELLRQDGAASGRLEAGADAVLARALAPFDEALALARPLARAGGWTALFASAAPAGRESEPYRLPGEAQDRFLVFSRRDG